MKTIAIIPARGGSKRLPQKNILPLDGIPLLAHSIIYAQKNSDLIDAIYVSTDDAEIKAVALSYGAYVIDRPDELSGDHEPTATALQNVVEMIGDPEISTVILLQPTNPLRPPALLRDALASFNESDTDSLFTVSQNHLKFGKIIGNRFIPVNYEPGQRSQDLEPLYYENGLLYISSVELILKAKIFSEKAIPMVVDHEFAAVDIDTIQDFDYASFLLKLNKI